MSRLWRSLPWTFGMTPLHLLGSPGTVGMDCQASSVSREHQGIDLWSSMSLVWLKLDWRLCSVFPWNSWSQIEDSALCFWAALSRPHGRTGATGSAHPHFFLLSWSGMKCQSSPPPAVFTPGNCSFLFHRAQFQPGVMELNISLSFPLLAPGLSK